MRKEKQKPLILIVEDDPVMLRTYRRQLEDYVEIIEARDAEDGRQAFNQNKDRIHLIVLDYDVRGGTTIELLRYMRPLFLGVIIAAADHPTRRDIMCEVYKCDVSAEKPNAPNEILEILGIKT